MQVGQQVEKGKFRKVAFNKDELVRHGVILGSTGSGKTGLGIKLLEELALEGVPIIAIDPKGDLGNMLTVPLLGKAEGEWSEERDKKVCKDIIKRGKLKSVDMAIYTPGVQQGESSGKRMGIYGSSKESRSEYLRQVLSLAYGYEINALATQVVFLEKNIEAWCGAYDSGKNQVTVDTMIALSIRPYTSSIGGMQLDDYISESERTTLARKLTSLSESSDFKKWEGELNIARLFVDGDSFSHRMGCWEGERIKPRLSIVSIAHLNEQERKFFLPIFLSELVQTMRTWQGTDKLRAVLYIDECSGLIPPVSNPPAKQWIMTLLKQARAYGLGVMLATQNPADIDYKGLGNVGSWWIGRLQTDLDRKKVREAVRASDGALAGMNNGKGSNVGGVNLGSLLGELEPRQFVQSINGGSPILVKSNDCLSRLSGPMSLRDIAGVTEWRRVHNVSWQRGESQEKTYRRMLVAGAKSATYGMQAELDDIRYIRSAIPETSGYVGLPNFLWRESVKPILKARLRMVQDDLMKAYVVNAKAKIRKEKQVG